PPYLPRKLLPKRQFPVPAARAPRLRAFLLRVPRRTRPLRALRRSATGPLLPLRSLLLPEFPQLQPAWPVQRPRDRNTPERPPGFRPRRDPFRAHRLRLPLLLQPPLHRTPPPRSSRANV